jgi:hypothetical protein
MADEGGGPLPSPVRSWRSRRGNGRVAQASTAVMVGVMSFAELKSELKKLSPDQLEEIEQTVRHLKANPETAGRSMAEFFGCGRGLMISHPGWDEDEPLEAVTLGF